MAVTEVYMRSTSSCWTFPVGSAYLSFQASHTASKESRELRSCISPLAVGLDLGQHWMEWQWGLQEKDTWKGSHAHPHDPCWGTPQQRHRAYVRSPKAGRLPWEDRNAESTDKSDTYWWNLHALQWQRIMWCTVECCFHYMLSLPWGTLEYQSWNISSILSTFQAGIGNLCILHLLIYNWFLLSAVCMGTNFRILYLHVVIGTDYVVLAGPHLFTMS